MREIADGTKGKVYNVWFKMLWRYTKKLWCIYSENTWKYKGKNIKLAYLLINTRRIDWNFFKIKTNKGRNRSITSELKGKGISNQNSIRQRENIRGNYLIVRWESNQEGWCLDQKRYNTRPKIFLPRSSEKNGQNFGDLISLKHVKTFQYVVYTLVKSESFMKWLLCSRILQRNPKN